MRLTHDLLLLYDYERMNCFLLTLYLMFLLDSVLGPLPAPVNVSVRSVNFHHVLHWDPGPGTPPGTKYYIVKRVGGSKNNQTQISTKTSVRLRLDQRKLYYLTVQASYNQTLSPVSRKVPFKGIKDTKIDAPKLSVAGCGNCIQINISAPKAAKKLNHYFFIVSCRKSNESVTNDYESRNNSFTIYNLEKHEEYCVQARIKSFENKNIEPSPWTCTFTSIPGPRRVYVLIGVGAVLLMLTVSLVTFFFCLHYTGFICKMKATLPRALITSLIPDNILSLERTIPDLISVGPEMDEQNKPTVPLPATRANRSGEDEEEEDDEDEEVEEKNIYMDRDTGISSGESSGQDSRDVSGNRTLAASVRSPSEVEEVDTQFDHEELNQYEAKDEGAEVSFMGDGGQTEVQGRVTGEEEEDEEEEEEACHSSGHINLFSVTLATLAVGEEEEEEQNTRDSLTDFLKFSDLEPLIPTDSKRTLSRTVSQTESDDQITVALTQPPPQDVYETGYEGRRAHPSSGCLEASDGETQQEEEEEEEEEESSGYMGRM